MKTKKILWALASLIIMLLVIVPLTNCDLGGEESPTVRTVGFSAVSDISATCSGEVTAIGSSDITARGICWNDTAVTWITGPHTVETGGIGNFSSVLTDLEPNTRYYFKAYATNAKGTSYGSGMTFVTGSNSGIIPSVTTAPVTNVSDSSATCGGNVTDEGSSPVTLRGVFWSTDSIPATSDPYTIDGTGTGTFTSQMTNLQPNTEYFVMAYATNSAGTGFGGIVSFVTDILPGSLPWVSTTGITNITDSTATSGGEVIDEGSSPVVSRGVCWSTIQNPTLADPHTSDGTGPGFFTSNLSGLMPGTPYFVRAYATNSTGTSYGGEASFTTTGNNTFIDPRDGEDYPIVTIGTQVWLGKNMTYVAGTNWCYDNNPANCDTYGPLYDWATALTVCPSGWRLPTKAEFEALVAYLGTDAGGKLKEAGTAHWLSPNVGGTNESGFTALPAGFYQANGNFYSLHARAGFWSSDEQSPASPLAWYLYLVDYNAIAYFFSNDKDIGFSVRCIQD
jgi:uncharacterized protein (TIGR02145 family)